MREIDRDGEGFGWKLITIKVTRIAEMCILITRSDDFYPTGLSGTLKAPWKSEEKTSIFSLMTGQSGFKREIKLYNEEKVAHPLKNDAVLFR